MSVLPETYTALKLSVTRGKATVELSVVGDYPRAVALVGYVEAVLMAADDRADSAEVERLRVEIDGVR